MKASNVFHPRGLFIGIAAGAVIGILIYYIFNWNELYLIGTDRQVRDVLLTACILATLGGLAGGFVKRTGWIMIAAAMIGWIVIGILWVLARHHIKAMIYGALFGTPLGAFLGYRFAIRYESLNVANREKPLPETTTGVWDREFDG
jgi:hypothetical protein